MSVLCVIPARAGSKRITRKNWQTIDRRSLVQHAHDAARESGVCDRIVVSSDSDDWPAMEVIHRPEHLSQGETDSLSRTVQHALAEAEKEGQRYDLIVTLQPATPLRSATLIREMVRNVQENGCNGGITMAKTVPWTWRISAGMAENGWFPKPYPLSQDCNFASLQEVNTVQIAHRSAVIAGKRWGLPLLIAVMPSWATIDIDAPEDLEECRRLWSALKREMDNRSGFPFHVARSINGKTE